MLSTSVVRALSSFRRGRGTRGAGSALLSRTDANGHATTFTYDVMNRIATESLPGGGATETISYNPTGTQANVADFNGKTSTFSYDSMNRLLSRTPDPSFNEPPITFTYTVAGLRSAMSDASGTTNYAYDNQNRLLGRVTPFGTLSYSYDAAGNRLSVTSSNANGVKTSYAYDELNRLKMVTDNRLTGPNTTTYSYDAVGNVSSTVLPNGVQESPNWDTMNRLTNLSLTSAPAANYAYVYGPVGNRTSATEASGRSASYGYDSIYRLMQETIAGDPKGNNGALGYSLDPVGNRLALNSTLSALSSQSFTYNANDRIVGNTYDANGNTLVSGARSFGYDSMDRLVNFNNGSTTMVYDGDGNRVSKGTTQFLVDDNNSTGLPQVVEEISGGSVVRAYTYGLERISQRQLLNGSWQTSFYGYDGHGDVRALLSPAGVVTDTYEYDSWGNTVSQAGSTPNVFLYRGEQYDSETHLYYLRARYFDSLTGRFLTVDPLAAQGQRPYLYAGADPVNGQDPTGQQDLIEYTLLLWLLPQIAPVHFHNCYMDIIMTAFSFNPTIIMNAANKCDPPPKKCPWQVRSRPLNPLNGVPGASKARIDHYFFYNTQTNQSIGLTPKGGFSLTVGFGKAVPGAWETGESGGKVEIDVPDYACNCVDKKTKNPGAPPDYCTYEGNRNTNPHPTCTNCIGWALSVLQTCYNQAYSGQQ